MRDYLRILLPATVTEAVTSTVAGAMVTVPAWHQQLVSVSEVFGLLAPILGTIWICLQIVEKLAWLRRRQQIHDDDERDRKHPGLGA